MSGMLDRMAKRALGELPVVQPLSTPRYAQASMGLGEKLGLTEADIEQTSPAPSARRQPEVEANRPRRERLATETNPQAAVPQTQPVEKPAMAQREPRRVPVDEPPPQPIALPRKPAPEPAALRPLPPAPQLPAAIHREPEAKPVIEPVAVQFRHDEQVAAKASEAKANFLEQPRLAPSSKGLRKDKREDAASPAQPKTEIHISIGSIELRAAKPDAKPASAAFRPRVTLDDFLRRKPEAGA